MNIADLHQAWTISDLGDAHFCIGIAIKQDRNARTVSISQTALIDKIISEFRLSAAAPVNTPMDSSIKLSRANPSSAQEAAAHLPYHALVGSLNYVAISSHPDIMFAVQQLAQFLDCYTDEHWDTAKRVVRYLKGTRDLVLGGSCAAHLIGFSDSDHARCPDTRKSIRGYCFSLGSSVVLWAARKQATVTDSSTEAEYIAASDASKECMWLQHLLDAIGFQQRGPSSLYVDNNGAIVFLGDQFFHSHTKHIDVKYHILRHYTSTSQLSVHYVHSANNLADIFTKPLVFPAFSRCRGFPSLH